MMDYCPAGFTMDIRNQVYNILLTPICVDKKAESIFVRDNIIVSPQRYFRGDDADMSDIAIEFYKVLYNNIFDNRDYLDNDGKLIDKEFAGDTMHSFHTIANAVDRLNIRDDKLSELIQHYQKRYHCLANFWVIPMRHGRLSKKNNEYDSLDIYMEDLKMSWGAEKDKSIIYYGKNNNEKYKNYFAYDYISEFKAFCEGQYVQRWDKNIREKYFNKQYKAIVEYMIKSIEERARLIVQNNLMCFNLFNMFKRYGLIYYDIAGITREIEFFCPVYGGYVTQYDCDEVSCGAKYGELGNDGIPHLMSISEIKAKAHLCLSCRKNEKKNSEGILVELRNGINDIMWGILDEYRDKFGEPFPMFLARHLNEKEIIQLVIDCIKNNEPYEPELDDHADYMAHEESLDEFYKKNPDDKIWWLDNGDECKGEFIFTFDKKQLFNLFADYPHQLTKEQKEIFDKENPYWKEFFKDR